MATLWAVGLGEPRLLAVVDHGLSSGVGLDFSAEVSPLLSVWLGLADPRPLGSGLDFKHWNGLSSGLRVALDSALRAGLGWG